MPRLLGRCLGGLAPILLAVGLGACDAAATATTSTRTPAHPAGGGGASAPARDTFSGSIVRATGAYSGYRGRVKIYVHSRGSGQKRPLRLVVRGACRTAPGNCRSLSGALIGSIAHAGHQLPDVGNGFTLTGAGPVSPLGHATGRGSVQGTGFIARGYETLTLTLTTSRGSVTVSAQTGPVKGFSSP
jgi:hypothetical protein